MEKVKREQILNYTFRGSSEKLKRLEQLIRKAIEKAAPPIDPQGPIENWGQSGGWVRDFETGWSQSGGWYLVVENDKLIKVSQPDKSLTKVSTTVYEALSKAEQKG